MSSFEDLADVVAPQVLLDAIRIGLLLFSVQQGEENRYRQPVLRPPRRRLGLDERGQVEDTHRKLAVADRRRVLQQVVVTPAVVEPAQYVQRPEPRREVELSSAKEVTLWGKQPGCGPISTRREHLLSTRSS